MPPRVKKNKKETSKAAPGRPKITEKDLENLSSTVQEHFHWKNSLHTFQVEAIKAQLLRKDVLVHAGTGSGKTAIAAGPHAHEKCKGMVTLMVSPLISLQTEQVETFKNDFNLKAIAVNSSNGGCTPHLMKQMCSGKWQVVIVSPEMLLSKKFTRNVLRKPEMARRIISVVVDEAHVISHWGEGFRKAYGRLGVLRALLPKDTPLVAMSATLPRKVRRDVLAKLQFSSDYLNVNIGNDRPNVSIVVRAIQNTMNSYTDLQFLIPDGVTTKEQVPKAFVYADNITTGTEIEDYLSQLHPREFGHIVRPYSSAFSARYRKEVMADFKAGRVRILVCTDAAGMGCNIPDIEIVVQWKMPTSVSSFVQRAGRAARTPDGVGLAVLLVEKSAYEVDLLALAEELQNDENKKTQESKQGKQKNKGGRGKAKQSQGKARNEANPAKELTLKERAAAKAEYAVGHGVRRGALGGEHDAPPKATSIPLLLDTDDEGLHTFVQSTTCRRRLLGEIYGNDQPVKTPKIPCCDICDHSLFNRTRPGKPRTTPRAPSVTQGLPDGNFRARLDEWRVRMFKKDFAHLSSQMGPSFILGDKTIEILLSVGPFESKERLKNLIGGQWRWYARYGESLLTELQTFQIVFRPKPKKKNTKRARDPEEIESGRGEDASVTSAHKRQRVSAAVADDAHNPTQLPPSHLPSSDATQLHQPTTTSVFSPENGFHTFQATLQPSQNPYMLQPSQLAYMPMRFAPNSTLPSPGTPLPQIQLRHHVQHVPSPATPVPQRRRRAQQAVPPTTKSPHITASTSRTTAPTYAQQGVGHAPSLPPGYPSIAHPAARQNLNQYHPYTYARPSPAASQPPASPTPSLASFSQPMQYHGTPRDHMNLSYTQTYQYQQPPSYGGGFTQ